MADHASAADDGTHEVANNTSSSSRQTHTRGTPAVDIKTAESHLVSEERSPCLPPRGTGPLLFTSTEIIRNTEQLVPGAAQNTQPIEFTRASKASPREPLPWRYHYLLPGTWYYARYPESTMPLKKENPLAGIRNENALTVLRS